MKIYQAFIPFMLALVMYSMPTRSFAQWNTNTSVNLEISGLEVADMQSAPTSDGKIWIAFYTPNASNYDMRAQLIDADGNKLLGPNGMLVSSQPTGTATFVFNVCTDLNNNLVIGCQDERSGDMQAVMYKISQAGTQMWGANGIVLGGGLAPYPAALTNGEVVVCWNETVSNTLKLQKITNGGTLAWGSAISILVGASTTTRGQIIGNLNDKFTVVYQKNSGGMSTTLYSQMFSSSGTALYAPLNIATQTTAAYRYYSLLADGDTTYYGYYASPGLRFNSFLQRINPGGTIPWGINGSNFNTSTSGTDSYQMETRIGFQPGSNYVWSVCTFSDPNQVVYGVYIQKFNKVSGARMFTDLGKIVYPISSSMDTQAGNMVVVDDNPMFMSYDQNYKIYATRLDANGNFAWPGNRVEISSTTVSMANAKGRYGFTAAGPNKCAGAWTENRGSGEMGYAQGVSIGGLIGLDVATQGGVPATITTSAGTLQMVATVYPSSANQNVTWSIVPGTGAATINTSGLVSALFNGTVYAKAVSVQDPTMMDSLLITISNQVPVLATVITQPATAISLTGATLHGTVNANNWNSTITFEWGLTNTYGNVATGTPSQATGNTSTLTLASLGSLASGTTYHYRCVANNAAGISYGQDLTFTTLCLLAGTIGSISGPATVCATSTGNVYTIPAYPAATSYVWTVPTGATITAGNNTNSITVSYAINAQSGNFTVYATDGTCISLTSQPFAVTVNPVPVQAGPISGIQGLCEGTMGVQYSIPPMPGVSNFLWTVPTGAVIASGQGTTSIVVDFPAGAVSGNITVYGTNDCGTGAGSVPLPIDIYPLPLTPGAISGPDHICAEAGNVQYSVPAVTNAFGYVWALPSGATITAGSNTNQITVHYAANAISGNITVYGTNGNCLGATSAPLAVTVNPTPATPVITQNGDTLTSSANTGNQWYVDGTLIPGATGRQHVAVIAGNYTVVVTLSGCSSAPSAGLYVLPVGLSEMNATSQWKIYPNPSNGRFTLELSSKKVFSGSIRIYNKLGLLVYENTGIRSEGTPTIPIDLKSAPAGVYLVVINNGEGIMSGKINIVH